MSSLANGRIVLRVHNINKRPLAREDLGPVEGHFEPSTQEKEHPPVRISVWDSTLTKVEEAIYFRGITPDQAIVWAASVDDIRKIKAPDQPAIFLDVIYDPLVEPRASEPGAVGHCGIYHLGSGGNKSEKIARKMARQILADCFGLIHPLKPPNP